MGAFEFAKRLADFHEASMLPLASGSLLSGGPALRPPPPPGPRSPSSPLRPRLAEGKETGTALPRRCSGRVTSLHGPRVGRGRGEVPAGDPPELSCRSGVSTNRHDRAESDTRRDRRGRMMATVLGFSLRQGIRAAGNDGACLRRKRKPPRREHSPTRSGGDDAAEEEGKRWSTDVIGEARNTISSRRAKPSPANSVHYRVSSRSVNCVVGPGTSKR